jgi:hypothetical protein
VADSACTGGVGHDRGVGGIRVIAMTISNHEA